MDDLHQEALERFQKLLAAARETALPEPTAVTLATAGADARPSARTVLLKAADERGFVFYTNLRSRKGRQLRENPHAALCFFWQTLFEQVLVEGPVQAVSDEEADAYWVRRPRESQLGAWASAQSEPLESRETLERRFAEYRERFAGAPVPRPPHWSGFRLVPERFEFWRFADARLHDRVCYWRENGKWAVTLLNP